MEWLDEALKQALARNADELDRWTKYKREQETAISNLKQFRDSLTIDVMVPVGSKAFMPGQLYHTNEILISHYRGIFSKCSSQQAQKVAMHRIKMAQTRLEDLEKERAMYQNKLEKPHLEGMLPAGIEQEIVEEYDEEKENKWRIEHKRRLREEKMKDRNPESESQTDKSHGDIMTMLENLEMMEQLEDDLNQLRVEDDETLEKLMSGEIQLPAEKKRTSNYAERDVIIGENTEPKDSVAKKSSIVDEIQEKLKMFNLTNVKKDVDFTNNNTLQNATDFESDDDSGSSSTEDIPPRVLEIEDQAKNLSVADKIKFFKKKLKEVEKELHQIQVKSVDDIDEKISRMEVREFLSDYIELLKDELVEELQSEKDTLKESKVRETKVVDARNKKRITFSNKEEVQLIDKTQAPNMVKRSKAKLSNGSHSAQNIKSPSTMVSDSPVEASNVALLSPEVEKKQEIFEKVQNNLEFVSENQSHQDFNLIDKIIDLSTSKCHTLEIRFDHSDHYFMPPGYEIDESKDSDAIGGPADIYKIFKDYFPSGMHEEEFILKVPDFVSPETDKQSVITENNVYPQITKLINVSHDGKSNEIFSNLSHVKFENENGVKTDGTPDKLIKPILKNKEKVKLETINSAPVKSKRTKTKTNENAAGFDLIMGDVVERQTATNSQTKEAETSGRAQNKQDLPDPLPEGKFVDVCAPKTRISRFKQMRANS